jgi:hypothetical protein
MLCVKVSNKFDYQFKHVYSHTLLRDNIITSSDYRRGFGLEIGFIDHFNTRLANTFNYSAIADFHILQITTA